MADRENIIVGADVEDDADVDVGQENLANPPNPNFGRIPRRTVFALILLALNLLNYVDRFTVAATLVDIQKFYLAFDSQLGLIQTVFVISYMLAAPVFGYCGDRYNRKKLICLGLSIWIVAVLISSVGASFNVFLLSRALVGVGEAAFSTIAPSIIGDLFAGGARSRMLMAFFSAMPIGSGLGYIIGSSISAWSGDWRWSLRSTPIVGAFLLVVLILVFEEPERGDADDEIRLNTNSYREDIESLYRIPTYVLVTAGQTSVMFATGALSWWAPTLTEHAWGMLHFTSRVPESVKAEIGRTFGLLMCFGGLLGVAAGSIIARVWTKGYLCDRLYPLYEFICYYFRELFRFEQPGWHNHPPNQPEPDPDVPTGLAINILANPRADPLVCALGSAMAVLVMWFTLLMFEKSMDAGWVFTFFTIFLLCLNIPITTDIILSVTPPNRRATAIAIQTLVAHLLGDAASPYMIGLLSDWFHSPTAIGPAAQSMDNFLALRNALFLPNLVLILSVVFYLKAAKTIEKDRHNYAVFMHDTIPPSIFDGNL